MRSSMFKLSVPVVLGGGVLFITAGALANDDGDGRRPLTVAVYGDAPYGTSPTDTTQTAATPAFIDAINADPDVSLVMHVGDIHSGKQYCTEAYDRQVFDLWKALQGSARSTRRATTSGPTATRRPRAAAPTTRPPGQIDYVLDADGNPVDYANGDPVANLDLVRSIFFPQPGARARRHAEAGAVAGACATTARTRRTRKYVENVMWEQNGVLFVTINLPGGSNNDTDVWYGAPADDAPRRRRRSSERTGADLRWLDAAFALARRGRRQGRRHHGPGRHVGPREGRRAPGRLRAVRRERRRAHARLRQARADAQRRLARLPLGQPAVARPIPLDYMHPGYDVPNFHRIVVHGSTFPLEWLQLTIDPRANAANGANAFGPFAWQDELP